MKTGNNSKPKACRSKAYSKGGIWICAALLNNQEITDAEKHLVALIDGLTTSKKPCDRYSWELAKMVKLTLMRTDSLLESLKRRRYVIELWGWGGKDWVCRVVAPEVSSKPATVRKHIADHVREYGSGGGEISRPPLPLALPS
jgi:hypothetical protein